MLAWPDGSGFCDWNMKPQHHLLLSAGSGTMLGVLLSSWKTGVSCGLIGILIDLDHWVDFWIDRGFSLDTKAFFDFCYRGTSRKFYDILHGYEYHLPLLWLASRPGWSDVGIGLCVGYALHLLADQFSNTHLNRWTYFLTFRILHRFEFSRIVLGPASHGMERRPRGRKDGPSNLAP